MKAKRLFAFALAGVVLCATGCGKEAKEKEADEVKIEDIDWSVEEGEVEDAKCVTLKFTNNTDVTIVDFEIGFAEKEGLKDDEKDQFLADLQKEFDYSDDEIASVKDMEISAHAGSESLVKPGDEHGNEAFYYFSGTVTMTNMDHYDLLEPETAYLRYIDDGFVYTEYYDFASGKYVDGGVEPTEAVTWTESDLGKKLPKPDVEYLKAGTESESSISFSAYGMSEDDFNAYNEKLLDKGYDNNTTSIENYFTGVNEKGNIIKTYYYKDKQCMHVTVSEN